MLSDLAGMAFRNISRKKARMSLVILALGFSIALITSIYTSTNATNTNIQNMIDKANSNSQAAIDNANANTQSLIDNASTNTQNMIRGANANTSAMVNRTIQSTQEMIDSVNSRTTDMITSIEQQYNDTVNQTEAQMTMITVTNSSRRTNQPPGQGGPGGQQPPGMSGQTSTTIDAEIIANISEIEGVDVIVPVVQKSIGHNTTPNETINWTGPGGGPSGPRVTTDYNVYGIPVNQTVDAKYHIWPLDIVNGSTLNETDNLSVLIHRDLMSYFNAGVGDTVSINGTNMTIKGIYYSSLQNKSVYMSIADSELVLGMDNGSANTLNVFAVNISAVDNVTDTIRYYYPNFTVEAFKNTASSSAEFVQRQQQMQVSRLMADAANQTKQLEATRDKQVAQMNADLANQVSQLERDLGVQVNQSKEDLSDQVNQSKADQERQVGQLQDDMFVFQTVGNLIIGVSAITAALIVFFMMFYAVRERTREIGVLKALGFTGGNILTGFLVEGMAIGFLGGFVGTVIALAAGRVLSDYLLPSTSAYTPASPDMPLVLVVLALSTVLGALGSLYPAWTASRKSAVEAMHNV